MDFRFTSHSGSVSVTCSMEHQALANWFNTEVRLNSALIDTALAALQKANAFSFGQEVCLIGTEYSLFIHADEVVIKANNLAINHTSQPIFDDDLHYYDEESIASCGQEDFEHFLLSYLDFTA